MKIKTSNAIRLCLVLLLLALTAICIFWLPEAAVYTAGFFTLKEGLARPLVFSGCLIIALPLFFVVLSAFRFCIAVEKDEIFTRETAKLIKCISVVIAVDCTFFIAAVISLFCAGERLLSPPLAFIAVIGFALALMLGILSSYVEQAAELKEEAEFTL